MTLYVLVGLDIKYADWCGWGNPAWFPISSQRIGGEPVQLNKSFQRGKLINPFIFLCIMDIEIFDNFLSESEAQKVLNMCFSSNYNYGESDSPTNEKIKTPPTGMVCNIDLGDYIYNVLDEKLQIKFPSIYCGNVLRAQYVNCYAPNEASYFHTDCEEEDEWYDVGTTIIYYPNKNLNINEGGETQFYIEDRILGIPPVYNRLIKFKVPVLHRATPFKNFHRFSIAFKFLQRIKK